MKKISKILFDLFLNIKYYDTNSKLGFKPNLKMWCVGKPLF